MINVRTTSGNRRIAYGKIESSFTKVRPDMGKFIKRRRLEHHRSNRIAEPKFRRCFAEATNFRLDKLLLTLQLIKRFSHGLRLIANYTLSKATDDAPEQNLTTGNIQGLVLSDPTNRALTKVFL